jgi:hypothetical protein
VLYTSFFLFITIGRLGCSLDLLIYSIRTANTVTFLTDGGTIVHIENALIQLGATPQEIVDWIDKRYPVYKHEMPLKDKISQRLSKPSGSFQLTEDGKRQAWSVDQSNKRRWPKAKLRLGPKIRDAFLKNSSQPLSVDEIDSHLISTFDHHLPILPLLPLFLTPLFSHTSNPIILPHGSANCTWNSDPAVRQKNEL